MPFVRAFCLLLLPTTILVGALDALAAIFIYQLHGGKDSSVVFNFIASGLWGEEAFEEKTRFYLLGVLVHYLIAGAWTLLYFLIYPKLRARRLHFLLQGCIFGLVIWLVMNFIVMPLSSTPPLPMTALRHFLELLAVITAVGIPNALVCHNWRDHIMSPH